MANLELRQEFQGRHMSGTAIELSNRQNTGWTQKQNASAILEITYPSADVRKALDAISTAAAGKPVVMIGQRGSGKSHIMALIHYAFEVPEAVEEWAHDWGQRLHVPKLTELTLQRGFKAVSETLSNAEFPVLWDVLFDRHPRGAYYKGRFAQSGTLIPSKSLIQDMFSEQKTALILDEFQTWYDGLHNEPGAEGRKLLQWAFNFIQILSEIAEERPDLFCLIVSVRDNTTDAFQQLHRKGPVIIDFKGETARDDRKRLVLHRLFKNRSNIPLGTIQEAVATYAKERNRLLFAERSPADQAKLTEECAECWPYSPELMNLLEDQILMAAAAQDSRDFIRMLAEIYRARGANRAVITPADFSVDDDECGVTTLIDSFATNADQEQLREKAIRNLQAVKEAKVNAPHTREVISSIWVRSLSSIIQAGGATRREIQLDLTKSSTVDDNAFTAELAEIVDNSFNIHPLGSHEKRYCFRLPENPESKLKAWARNDRAFDVQTAAAPGLMPLGRDQDFLCKFLNHYLKSPDLSRELPSQIVVLDINWTTAPWANVLQQEQPSAWTEKGKPVLLVLPASPSDVGTILGPWLATYVPQNRNMVRFLLPKADLPDIYLDKNLLLKARCALLAKEWQDTDAQYRDLKKKYDDELKNELKNRFDRFAILATWNFQAPSTCEFHVEEHGASGPDIPASVEKHIRDNFFAPEDFEKAVLDLAGRNETVRQLLTTLREPPLPGQDTIPYLGDLQIFESLYRIAGKGKLALNAGGRWYSREPGESQEEAESRLRIKLGAYSSGAAMLSVQLGEISQIGGSGVAAPAPPPPTPPATPPIFQPAPSPLPGNGGSFGSPAPAGPIVEPSAPIPSPLPPQPEVRKSIGAKTGMNLLGDLEKWALSDNRKTSQVSLTFTGLTVKEVRDLCVKLPAKLQAELQMILPFDEGKNA